MFALVKLVQFWISPPPVGSVLSGDAFDFLICNRLEKTLYGLCSLEGNKLYDVQFGHDSFRAVVLQSTPSYVLLSYEIKTKELKNDQICWLSRSYPKKLHKKAFLDLLSKGVLK